MERNSQNSIVSHSNIIIDPSLLNEDGTLNFHTACATNRLDIISYMIQECQLDINRKVNSFDYLGFTLLHFAILNCKVEIVKYLLFECNVDLTIQDARGQTALHLACRTGQDGILELILHEFDRKLDDQSLINLVDNTGLSLFHISCSNIRCNLAKRFIKTKRIDISAKINENSDKWPGCTALHIAVDYENVEIVKMLLDSGIDPNATEINHMTPLHFACKFSDQKIEELIILTQAWYATDELDLLESLINHNNDNDLINIVRDLINYGSDVNAKDKMGKTPMLHLYDPEVEGELVKHTINEYLNLGTKRHVILENLLEHGANLNDEDINGLKFFDMIADCYNDDRSVAYEKAIMVALKSMQRNIKRTSLIPLQVHIELDYNDIENENSNDNSRIFRDYATILSSYDEKHELAEFIENGLDLNFELDNGKNVLHVIFSRSANSGFQDDVINEEKECSTMDLIEIFLNAERRTSMINIFNLDWNLNSRDFNGLTPLHFASLRHDWRDVSFLLSIGADLDIVDNQGRTPLDCCSNEKCKAQLLLICHIKRMRKFGCSMNEENVKRVKVLEKNSYYQENLIDEFERDERNLQELKKIKIIHSATFYDLLFKSTRELIVYVKNPIFLEWIEINHLVGELRYFAGLLRMQSIRSLSKLPFLDSAKEALNHLAHFHLPVICSDRILDFLNSIEVKHLSETKPVELIEKPNLKRKKESESFECKRKKCE